MPNKKAYVNVELLKPMHIIPTNITCIQCEGNASYIQCAIPNRENKTIQIIARSTYCKNHVGLIASKRDIPIANTDEELKSLRVNGDYDELWKKLLS
ncbi:MULTISPECIES: hypothetical protein [Brevibacillus]|uniref:Uncharacterized protein n=1 Tax=Brevibacillus laterosporus TaxID=1465 RepID=A0AAP3DKY5_BRELA|nr:MULTISPECIES: hypothetical protein [Brevibacillus]ATO51744.1 hypothetical protein BrL25_23195 [Brevibacillus laterosporus DSM 25]MBG9773074.1 hypothetical protein [Brevibacillus laterosporus]MBG9789286.1 hypothetical protein [Brevibacillus laterosporus]MBG9798737.1 hypothetical protein [Brevibacillus laterosporus]MBG9802268.1 hypothetical protein [Brevibacillus laterosporus]